METPIAVGVLGATGLVGQTFVRLLSSHPWFRVTALAGSPRSQGKRYAEALEGGLPFGFSQEIAEMEILPLEPPFPCSILFSALQADVATVVEPLCAQAGHTVISNASSYRLHPEVPLIVPEINLSHLQSHQTAWGPGRIIASPNCSAIGISLVLAPLLPMGLERVSVVTLQALSGAGFAGPSSWEMLDNILPWIAHEEEKIETETRKILGSGITTPHPVQLSAQCNRVPVSDGHTACLSFRLAEAAQKETIAHLWQEFRGATSSLALPSAPHHPLHYHSAPQHPQPRLHRHLEGGMAVSIGRLRPCPLEGWKCTALSHNMVRGAAGNAILIAEALVRIGCITMGNERICTEQDLNL